MPIIPVTIIKMNKIRSQVTGSLNRTIPAISVPIAPIPVQIAYDVPGPSSCIASDKKKRLRNKSTHVAMVHGILLNFSDFSMLMTQQGSNSPATTMYTHTIEFIVLEKGCVVYYN